MSYKATLVSLQCKKPEESSLLSDGDELRLVVLVDGKQQHTAEHTGVRANTTIPIGKTFEFTNRVEVRLTELDGGLDPHDELGTVTIPAAIAGAGTQTFTGHGAEYVLTYTVIGLPIGGLPGTTDAAKVLADAQAQASKILNQAQAQAAKTLVDAQAQLQAAAASRAAAERELAAARAEAQRILQAAQAATGQGGAGAATADLSGVVGALGGLVGVGGGIIGALGALNASLSGIAGALQGLQTPAAPVVPAQSNGSPVVVG